MRHNLIGLVALVVFSATGALAQERGHHGGQGGSGYPRANGGFERGGYRGGPTYAPPPEFERGGGYGARGYPGVAPRGPFGPMPGPSGYRGFTRGQFLPPAYWGGAVVDPRQYHLRRPPNGYGWITVGPNAYLTQRSTGLILDTAPLY